MPTLQIVSGLELCGKDRTRLHAFTDSSVCPLLHSAFSDARLAYLAAEVPIKNYPEIRENLIRNESWKDAGRLKVPPR